MTTSKPAALNTHLQSIHKSVDQSFLRLANQYIRESFSDESEQNKICPNLMRMEDISKSNATNINLVHTKAWEANVQKDLNLFSEELTAKIAILRNAGTPEAEKLMKELYPTGYTDNDRIGEIFKFTKALAVLDDLRLNKSYKANFIIDPKMQLACGH